MSQCPIVPASRRPLSVLTSPLQSPAAPLPRLLIISHVLPFPGTAGQQLRVRYMVEAAASRFNVNFLTCAPREKKQEVHERLSSFDCHPIILESRLNGSGVGVLPYRLAAGLFVLRTGLKSSNYSIGKIELSPARIREAVSPGDYDIVLYEYFHAVDSVALFQAVGVPAVLDAHNVLWKSLEQHLPRQQFWPEAFRKARLARYRRQEERSWRRFDAVIAINRAEHRLIQPSLHPSQKLFYAPMGTDLSRWPYAWQPATPARVAYYGGLGSPHNQAAALRCHKHIMPAIWQRFPEAELWLVGSNPSDRLRTLTADPRVKVTGFVDRAQDVLSAMSLVLCPWSGTYGFRSRIVEVMALGVPVVATPEAVDGMELESGHGLLLADADEALAQQALELLSNPGRLKEQSRLARSEMERLYSLENTYGRLMNELHEWLEARKAKAQRREISNQ